MAKISKDLSAGNLHPREVIFGTGNLASLNAEVVLACDGAATVALDLRGTFSLTIEVSGSIDNVNWTPMPVRQINVAAVGYTASIVGTTPGVWVAKAAQYRFVRARVTAYTSGTATTFLAASNAPLDDTLQGNVAPVSVTATGVAGAAVTATIAAPGVGLRPYITGIRIVRSATALLTAAATPTVVTSTNLPGNPAWTFGQDAAAQGADKIITEDYVAALAASAQNTATTVVCPVTTGVIWRVTVYYYLAP
jgi:hypothetical protein